MYVHQDFHVEGWSPNADVILFEKGQRPTAELAIKRYSLRPGQLPVRQSCRFPSLCRAADVLSVIWFVRRHIATDNDPAVFFSNFGGGIKAPRFHSSEQLANPMKIIEAKLNGSVAEIVVEYEPDGSRYPIRFEAPSHSWFDVDADPIVVAPELTIEQLRRQCKLSDADARAIVVSYLL